MNIITFSKRLSDFVDAADVSGNIKNSRLNLQYIAHIDSACVKAGITTGAVYPFIGDNSISCSFNILNPAEYQINFLGGGWTYTNLGAKPNGSTSYATTGLYPNLVEANANILTLYHCSESTTVTGSMALYGAGTPGDIEVRLQPGQIRLVQTNIYSGINLALLGDRGTPALVGTSVSPTERYGIYNSDIFNFAYIGYGNNNTPSSEIYIGCKHNGNGNRNTYSNKTCGFFCQTSSMSVSKTKAFSHDIFVAQRSIGRA